MSIRRETDLFIPPVMGEDARTHGFQGGMDTTAFYLLASAHEGSDLTRTLQVGVNAVERGLIGKDPHSPWLVFRLRQEDQVTSIGITLDREQAKALRAALDAIIEGDHA